jgi:uncharacterized damage-inducible protein DinB
MMTPPVIYRDLCWSLVAGGVSRRLAARLGERNASNALWIKGAGLMKLTEMFLAELEREAASTRRTLERVPEGHYDFKPHEKSMSFGVLAGLVATMPLWVDFIVNRDFLDLNPPDGKRWTQPELRSAAELVAALDDGVVKARTVLENTTDEHLMLPWQLRSGGHVMSEESRYLTLRHSLFNHLAHHRGQLTVYLRLNEAKVPSIYGPSADEMHA